MLFINLNKPLKKILILGVYLLLLNDSNDMSKLHDLKNTSIVYFPNR